MDQKYAVPKSDYSIGNESSTAKTAGILRQLYYSCIFNCALDRLCNPKNMVLELVDALHRVGHIVGSDRVVNLILGARSSMHKASITSGFKHPKQAARKYDELEECISDLMAGCRQTALSLREHFSDYLRDPSTWTTKEHPDSMQQFWVRYWNLENSMFILEVFFTVASHHVSTRLNDRQWIGSGPCINLDLLEISVRRWADHAPSETSLWPPSTDVAERAKILDSISNQSPRTKMLAHSLSRDFNLVTFRKHVMDASQEVISTISNNTGHTTASDNDLSDHETELSAFARRQNARSALRYSARPANKYMSEEMVSAPPETFPSSQESTTFTQTLLRERQMIRDQFEHVWYGSAFTALRGPVVPGKSFPDYGVTENEWYQIKPVVGRYRIPRLHGRKYLRTFLLLGQYICCKAHWNMTCLRQPAISVLVVREENPDLAIVRRAHSTGVSAFLKQLWVLLGEVGDYPDLSFTMSMSTNSALDAVLQFVRRTLVATHRVSIGTHARDLQSDIYGFIARPPRGNTAASGSDSILSAALASVFSGGNCIKAFYTEANQPMGPALYPQSLSCLNGLLQGEKIWVLRDSFASPTLDLSRLYVACNIEDFQAIFGPVWPVFRSSSSSPSVSQRLSIYKTSHGFLLPWKSSSLNEPLLEYLAGPIPPRFCHWVSTRAYLAWEDAQAREDDSSDIGDDSIPVMDTEHEDWVEYNSIAPAFAEDDILLIGAPHSPRLRWGLPSPALSVDDFIKYTRGQNCLHQPGTRKLRRYFEKSYNLSISDHLAAGVTFASKLDPGQSIRQVFLDHWTFRPERRNPYDFDNLWGVAVSMCTTNACRVPLAELLGTPTMKLLLEPFEWSDLRMTFPKGRRVSKRREAFFEAIDGERGALGRLWEAKPLWREELGKVLLMCLQALADTGFDNARDEFYALWYPAGRRAYQVKLKPAEIGWVRVLRDSETSIAMAVLVEDAITLPSSCSYGRQRGGLPSSTLAEKPPVLETAVSMNPRIPPRLHRIDIEPGARNRVWRYKYDVGNVSHGEHIWLAHGRLSVIAPIDHEHLLLRWDPVKRDALRQWLGLNPSDRPVHWEYTNEDWDRYQDAFDRGNARVCPVPVHIQ